MQDVLIRQIANTDYDNLAAFLSGFPGDKRSPNQWLERFSYWWEDNPAFDDDWIRGFIITDSDKIVGFVGSFPTYFKCGEQILKAFNGTTWRVLKNYRNNSIDLWIKNREISNHLLSFNSTPTDTVIKLIKKLNYKILPWGSELESVYVLKPAEYAKHILTGRSGILILLTGWSIGIRQLVYRKSSQTILSYRLMNKADSSFDDLWEKTKGNVDCTNVRTAETVNWYSTNCTLIGIFKAEMLYGYAILSEVASSGIKDMYISDLWIYDKTDLQSVISGLVDFTLNIARQVNCTLIRFPHFSKALSGIFFTKGLLKKRITRRNYYRIPPILNTDFTYANSYFVMLQGDYGI